VFEQFSDQARQVVTRAAEEARVFRHAGLEPAHLLLAITSIRGCDAVRTMECLGASRDQVAEGIREELGGADPEDVPDEIPFTNRARKTLDRGLEEALALGDDFVGTAHLLLGILRAKKGTAVDVTRALGIDLERTRAVVAQLPTEEAIGGVHLERAVPDPPPTPDSVDPGTIATPPLELARCCSFCGRDLWDVTAFVHGEVGAICDECVVAAQRTIENAAEDQHGLTLPPRVFGTPPDRRAARTIEEAFRTVFGTFATTAHRQRLIEDGEQVAPRLELAQQRTGIRVMGVRLQRVRFRDDHTADVAFALQLSTRRWLPSEGTALQRDDDAWIISRDTISRLVQMVGIELPPPGT
jgi:hypothetical protein